MCHRKAGIAGALLNIIEAGPEFDPNEEPPDPDDDDARSDTDVRFRCELTSVIWVLSVATSGNLLAIPGERTPQFARNLLQVTHSLQYRACGTISTYFAWACCLMQCLLSVLLMTSLQPRSLHICRSCLPSQMNQTWTTQSSLH